MISFCRKVNFIKVAADLFYVNLKGNDFGKVTLPLVLVKWVYYMVHRNLVQALGALVQSGGKSKMILNASFTEVTGSEFQNGEKHFLGASKSEHSILQPFKKHTLLFGELGGVEFIKVFLNGFFWYHPTKIKRSLRDTAGRVDYGENFGIFFCHDKPLNGFSQIQANLLAQETDRLLKEVLL